MKPALVLVLLAYLMPSYSILRRLAHQRDELTISALKVEGSATVPHAVAKDLAPALGVEHGGGELQLSGTFAMKLPLRCRLELGALDTTRTASATWLQGRKKSEGPKVAGLEQALEQVCAVLALRSAGEGESRAALERHLGAMKVDSRKVSLGRFAGSVAWVLGGREASAPQFWVYKERFLPARVRWADDAGQAWDVRLLDYASTATSEWFPRQVEVYRGEQLQLRFTALSADGKPDADALGL